MPQIAETSSSLAPRVVTVSGACGSAIPLRLVRRGRCPATTTAQGAFGVVAVTA